MGKNKDVQKSSKEFKNQMIDEAGENIVKYQMTPMQALAYKVGFIWHFKSRKSFPNYNHSRGYPKSGDPRKCMLFQVCYKLVRETQGFLELEDYMLYIQAQLDIIKINSKNPLVDPNCLVGDKAWMRWLVWKKKYDKKSKINDDKDIKTPIEKIVVELERTKKFFFGRFEGQPKKEQIMMASTDMVRWVTLGKVSHYYAVLSPWAQKHCNFNSLDLEFYKNSINDEVRKKFKEIFDYESE